MAGLTRAFAALAFAFAVAAPSASAGELSEYRVGLSGDSHPHGIARGADGNLWFTDTGGPGRVSRVTPAGAITEFTAGLTPHAMPAGITPGPDGNMWFTESQRAA